MAYGKGGDNSSLSFRRPGTHDPEDAMEEDTAFADGDALTERESGEDENDADSGDLIDYTRPSRQKKNKPSLIIEIEEPENDSHNEGSLS